MENFHHFAACLGDYVFVCKLFIPCICLRCGVVGVYTSFFFQKTQHMISLVFIIVIFKFNIWEY